MPAQRDPGRSSPSSVFPVLRLGNFGLPHNRRDGARLLSVAILLAVACLTRLDHPLGRGLAVLTTSLALYWWGIYRRLDS